MKSKFNARVLSLILTVAIISTMLPSNMVFAIGDNTNQPTVSAGQNDAEQNDTEQSGENKQESPPENESEASPSEADKPTESEDGTLDDDISESEAPECGCTEKCTADKQSKDCPVCKDSFDKCTFVEPEAPECGCTEKCTAEKQSKDCPVCKNGFGKCTFVAEAPKCDCVKLCTEAEYKTDCPICKDGFEKCTYVVEAPKCDCTKLCTETEHKTDCPICKDGFEKCTFVAKAPKCDCTKLCTETEQKTDCPVCKDGFDKCTFVAPAPKCDCVKLCTEAEHKADCPVCKDGFEKCTYVAQAPTMAAVLAKVSELAAWYDGIAAASTEEAPTIDKDGVLLDDTSRTKFMDDYDAMMALADALVELLAKTEPDTDVYGVLSANEAFVRLTTLYRAMGSYLPVTGAALAPTVSVNGFGDLSIYGNGSALIITGTHYRTTIYWDKNRNGVVDGTDQSLKAAGIANAPNDGADLSGDYVYGGSSDAVLVTDTMVTMIGGGVYSIGGGSSYQSLTGNINVKVSGGNVGSNVWGGCVSSQVTGSTNIVITGGTIGVNVCGNSLDATSVVTGNANIDITGGTIGGGVFCGSLDNMGSGNVKGRREINIGGNPKIGSADLTKGIAINSVSTAVINVTSPLTGGDGNIVLINPHTTAVGAAIVSGTSEAAKFVLKGYTLYSQGNLIKISGAFAPTVSSITVHGNGSPLLITGTDANTLIYHDKNSNGIVDAADGAPIASGDLSKWYIYGGAASNALTANTKITMLGGKVWQIYGGGGQGGPSLSGNTEVIINGGTVDAIYGGGMSGTVSGTANVTVNGGTVTGWVAGGDGNDRGATVQSTVVAIQSGATVPVVYGGGVHGNVTGSTSVTIAGTVNGNVFGGASGIGTVGSTKVTVSGTVKGKIYGGSNSTAVQSTDVTISGGTVADVYGGGNSSGGNVTGSTSVTIQNGSTVKGVYGGAMKGTVSGTASVTMNGGTVTEWVTGGGSDPSATVQSSVVTIQSGATVQNVCGGGGHGNVTGSTSVTIAGTVNGSAFGGASGGGTAGSTKVTVSGTVKGNVHGGGYGTGANTASTDVTISGGTVGGVFGGGYNGNVTGSTKVKISGGTVSGNVVGGGNSGSVSGDTSVTVSGGSVGSIYGGGYQSSSSCVNAAIIITNGTIKTVQAGGSSGRVSGNGTVSISGGTIESYVNFKNVTGTKIINLSGNPKIGNKAKEGIELSTITDGMVTVTQYLTGAAGDITLVPATGAAVGTTVALVKNTANVDSTKFTMEGWALKPSINTIIIASILPTVDTARKTVYGNGTPLLITGTSDSSTTIYIDTNRDGMVNNSEQSLADSGVINAPSNGENLSEWTVAGANAAAGVAYGTLVSMSGGRVKFIYGGSGGPGDYGNTLTGSTLVIITGGKVDFLHGGCSAAAVNGNITIAVGGGTIQRINPTGWPGTTTGTTTLTISGNPIIGNGTRNSGIDVINFYYPGSGASAGTDKDKKYNGVINYGELTEGASIQLHTNIKSTALEYAIPKGMTIGTFKAGVTPNLQAIKAYSVDWNNPAYPLTAQTLTLSGQNIQLSAPAVTVDTTRKHIYGNGEPLVIEGTESGTTVYIDADRDGVLDADEPSLKKAGVIGAPEDNADLSAWRVYGGGAALTRGDTLITMNGGKLLVLAGGGNTAPLTGNTYVNIKGSAIVGELYGNSNNFATTGGQLNGSTYVNISGNAKLLYMQGTNYGGYVSGGGGSVYGNTNVTISGNAEIGLIAGAAVLATDVVGEVDVTGNATVTVSGGKINGISGTQAVSGGNGTINGNFTVNASGGTINYISANDNTKIKGTKTVNLSGNPKIGNSSTQGVILTGLTNTTATISGLLTGEPGDIMLLPPTDYSSGSAVAKATDTAHADASKFTVVGWTLKTVGNLIRLDQKQILPTVNTTDKHIYANGAALVIEGTESGTTVYIDTDRDGVHDAGEPSLKTAGVIDAPIDNADLSAWYVYGGTENTTFSGNTLVTMNGGKLYTIYGAGDKQESIISGGYTLVTMNGGTLNSIAGGGYLGDVGGGTNIIMNGGSVGSIIGGGVMSAAYVAGNTGITLRGGTVTGIIRAGSNFTAVENATLNIYGGTVDGEIYGGGYQSGGTVTGIATIKISEENPDVPTLLKSSVYGGASDGGTVGRTTIIISGGTVTGAVYGGAKVGTVSGSKTINVSGNPKIGDKAANGIKLSDTTAKKVNISGELTGNAGDITLINPSATTAAWADSGKFLLSGAVLYTDGVNIKIGNASAPSISVNAGQKTMVSGNGSALIVDGTSDTSTTVYWDKNRNGIVDLGDQSMKAAGITGAPINGTDLSNWDICGGTADQNGHLSGDALITVLGGKVNEIYGGSYHISTHTGSTYVNMSGGKAVSIRGGGYSNTLTGKANVNMTGGTVNYLSGGMQDGSSGGTNIKVGGTAEVSDISGGNTYTGTKGDINITISGNAKIGSITGGTGMTLPETNPPPSIITGNVTINLNGGTIAKYVNTQGSKVTINGSQTVNISGNPVVGDKKTLGINLSDTTAKKVNISGVLTGTNGNITLTNPSATTAGTVVATASNATTQADADKFTLSGSTLTAKDKDIVIGTPITPTVSINAIYGNGCALIINGTDAAATVYWDKNRNGIVDAGEKSLADNQIPLAPADGTDLSGYSIRGGSEKSALIGDTKITMLGGKVSQIFGGSGYGVTGSTNVSVSGGTVTSAVYGGCAANDAISADAVINISGGTVVNVTLSGSGATSTVGRNAIANISGGTITNYVSAPYVGSTANVSVNISGSPKIGNKTDKGIKLSTITDKKVTISGVLTGNAGDITLTNPSATADGTIVATASNATTQADVDKFTLSGSTLTAKDKDIVIGTPIVTEPAFTTLEIRKDTADGAVVVNLLDPASVAGNWALDTEADYYLYAALKKNAAADYIQIRYGTDDKYNGVTFANPPGGGFAAGPIAHDYFDSLSAYKDFENPAYGSSTARLALRDGTLTYHINSSIAANSPLNFSVGLVVNDGVYDGKNLIADALSISTGSYSGDTFTPKATKNADLKISDKNTIRSSMIQTTSTAELDGIGSTVYSYPIYNADSLKQAAVLFDTYTVEVTYPKGGGIGLRLQHYLCKDKQLLWKGFPCR